MVRQFLLCVVGSIAIASGAPAAARWPPPLGCSPPPGALPYGRVPPTYLDALRRDVGSFALPGQPFRAFDVGQERVDKGFLYAYRRPHHWLLVYWKGGSRVAKVGLASYQASPANQVHLRTAKEVAVGADCDALRSELRRLR